MRSTPDGREFFEINREVAGTVLATKNHQGGLYDPENESDGKIYAIPGFSTCPVETIKNYLKHLNPACESLFQRPKDANANKFHVNNSVWYTNSPVGERTRGNLLREMTKRAGIEPPLTNHSIRATSVTVLANANVETRLIKSITGQKSDTSIESYSNRPSSRQQEVMSSVLSDYISHSDSTTASSTTEDKENQIQLESDISVLAPSVSSANYDHQTTVVNKQQQSIQLNQARNFTALSPVFQIQNCTVNIYN